MRIWNGIESKSRRKLGISESSHSTETEEAKTHTTDTAVGDGNLYIVVFHSLALEVNDFEVGPGRSPCH